MVFVCFIQVSSGLAGQPNLNFYRQPLLWQDSPWVLSAAFAGSPQNKLQICWCKRALFNSSLGSEKIEMLDKCIEGEAKVGGREIFWVSADEVDEEYGKYWITYKKEE